MIQRFVIFAAAFAGCVQLSAQSDGGLRPAEKGLKVTGGPLIETNISGFIHTGVAGGHSLMHTGGSAGGFLNLGFAGAFSVQGEMIFHYKHSHFSWDGDSGGYSYWGVEIPVYAMYHVSLSGGSQLYFGIGPYTEFGFDASFMRNGVSSDLYAKDADSGLPVMRDSNTGFGVKIGYEFRSGLQLNASYKASITNQLYADGTTVCMRPHAVSIGVAYRFGR